MVGFYSHVVWATIPLYLYSQNLPLSLLAAGIGTFLTDALGHTGFRRNVLHNYLAVIIYPFMAMFILGREAYIAGIIAGITHLMLDQLRGHYWFWTFVTFFLGTVLLGILINRYYLW